jgi:hypothetical protein
MPTDEWQGAPGARVVAATDSEIMVVTGSIDEVATAVRRIVAQRLQLTP